MVQLPSDPPELVGRNEAARDVLLSVFGYSEFRGQQEDIVRAVLSGSDVLVLMPTGGGKSLCYQIPSLVLSGTGIVVSPLIALMQDQVRALEEVGVHAACLNSSLSREEQDEIEADLLAGKLDLLYIAPERLVQERTLRLFARCKIALIAIDEAHCVAQWGHDFRPEYRQLRILSDRFPGVPRLALTATADPRTREEIIAELSLERAVRFISSFDRPNIRYTIAEMSGGGSRQRLFDFIESEHSGNSGIIYCLSRRATEETAAWLTTKGRRALAYHAGLSAEARRQVLLQFLTEDNLVVVATIAFGMGIDKPDVRFVCHLNLPKSVEAYYQETGRAGRDGEPADAWMAYGLQDLVQQYQWIANSDAGDGFRRDQRRRLDSLIGLCESVTCRRQILLSYFGEQGCPPCGNCDNCLLPPSTIDGTVAAQKALSTVYRTQQRYGVGYLIDVLVGKKSGRIEQNGHNQLSVFGIGHDLDIGGWRGLFRQLIAAGYLSPDGDGHGTLSLNDSARSVLRGEQNVQVRHRPQNQARARRRNKTHADSEMSVADKELFQTLKRLRKELAVQASVPPYVICHDRSLRELATARPRNREELMTISGLGEKKVARYGRAFLQALAHAAR
ncbi:MAG: DNA helicase RecQ [Hyphomicrobiaceae bacterium]